MTKFKQHAKITHAGAKRFIAGSLALAGCALLAAAPPPPPVFVPEILITGQSSPIEDGSVQPLKLDGTYFGVAQIGVNVWEHAFEIRNVNNADLIVTSPISITGPNAADFTVTQQPATLVPPGQRTAFSIRYTPSFAGKAFATVNVSNNDRNEGEYTFDIRGDGSTEPLVGPDLRSDLVFFRKYKCQGIPLLACRMTGRVEVQNMVSDFSVNYALVRVWVVNGDVLNDSAYLLDEKWVKKLRNKPGKTPKAKRIKFKGYVPPGYTHIYSEVVPEGGIEDINYTNNRTSQLYGI